MFASLKILAVLVTLSGSVKLPPNFKKCNRKEPNFDQCALEAAQDGVKQLGRPYPELNLPNVNPLEIPEISVTTGQGNTVISQKFTECKFYGLTNVKLDKFKFDFDKKELDTAGLLFEATLKANYEMDGRLLVLPVKGKGESLAVLKNVTLEGALRFEEVKKKGKTYIKMVAVDVKTVSPALATFKFDNLFGADKTIGDNINQVLNENWREVFEELKSIYIEVLGDVLINLLNGFFSKVSMEEAFD